MKTRNLIYSVASVTILLAGTISLSATPACQRIIRVYKERVIHHHVTQATARRWAEWGKLHPNFRPKPRPKLAPEETLQKVAFACEVPLNPSTFESLLTPAEVTGFITPEETPVYIATVEPVFTLVGTPLSPAPLVPGDDVPTPEPSSLILLASALGLLVFWKRTTLLQSHAGKATLSSL